MAFNLFNWRKWCGYPAVVRMKIGISQRVLNDWRSLELLLSDSLFLLPLFQDRKEVYGTDALRRKSAVPALGRVQLTPLTLDKVFYFRHLEPHEWPFAAVSDCNESYIAGGDQAAQFAGGDAEPIGDLVGGEKLVSHRGPGAIATTL